MKYISNMELKGLALRLLKYLCSINHTITVGELKGKFIGEINASDFSEAKQYLINEKYITVDTDGNIAVLPKGKDYIEEYDEFASDEIFEGNYDFAILKFLHLMNEPVDVDTFPKYIVSHAPHEGKEMTGEFHLQSYIQFNKDLNRYVDCFNHSKFAINEMGKKYYLHLIDTTNRRLEIYNKPLVHIEKFDNSTHDHSTTVTGGRDAVFAPESKIEDSFKTNEETPEQKDIAKKGLLWSKRNVLVGVIAIIVAVALYLLTR